MAITSDDDTFDLLTPSGALLPVLTGLRTARSALGSLKTKTSARAWDNILFTEISCAIARFSLWIDGYDNGVIPSDNTDVQNDINHRLSSDYEMMSPDDLAERFRLILNRSEISSRYRRIAETPDITRLFKDSRALGWQGFKMESASETEKYLIRSRRMFVDFFRDDFDWTEMRAVEIADAAALIEYAVYVEMISREESEKFCRRLTTEAVTRYRSWNDLAQSLLTARVFMSLDEGELRAKLEIERTGTYLTDLLQGLWLDTPWPRLTH